MDVMAQRLWRAEALVPVSTLVDLPPGGGLPERLEPRSRIQPVEWAAGDLRARWSEHDGDLPGIAKDLRFSIAQLDFWIEAQSAEAAYAALAEPLERTLESLSFQLQEPLGVLSLELLDITAPVAPGEERDFSSWPAPHGYPLMKFRPAGHQMGGVHTVQMPDATVALDRSDGKANAALDWYIKALGAPFHVDQFIFFWIAAEVMWGRSDVRVEASYRARCGHEIVECPYCGTPTAKPVQGASIQEYFVTHGIDEDVARRLWRARQIMHGNERFDSAVIQALDELTQILRAVVCSELKLALGVAPDAPPLVEAGHVAIAGGFGLGGYRAITADDLT